MTFNDNANVGGGVAGLGGIAVRRQRWFRVGDENGPASCDTFSVSGAEL